MPAVILKLHPLFFYYCILSLETTALCSFAKVELNTQAQMHIYMYMSVVGRTKLDYCYTYSYSYLLKTKVNF